MIVTCISFSKDNLKLLSGSRDKTVKIWNIAGGIVLKTLSGHLQVISSVWFSPNVENRILSCGSDKTLKFWNAVCDNEVRSPFKSVLKTKRSFEKLETIKREKFDLIMNICQNHLFIKDVKLENVKS